MTTAHPLAWPPGWLRTDDAKRVDGRYHFRRPAASRASPFWTFADARDALLDELRRLGASDVVISSNFRADRDGVPVEGNRRPLDQGIAVYFTLGAGAPHVMARDGYTRAEENMRSLALAIEAMRAFDRHGDSLMMRRAFEGFAALPAPRSWHQVLGLKPDASAASIEAAFRAKARHAHPDAGGSDAAMAELNAAREAALKEQLAARLAP